MYRVIAIIILSITTVTSGYLSYRFYSSNQSYRELLNLRQGELTTAQQQLGIANTKVGDLEKILPLLEKKLQEEVKKHKETLTLYAELYTKYEAEKNKVKTITKIVYQDKIVDLPKGKLFIHLDDNSYKEITSIKYSYQDFRINIDGDAIESTISYKLHQKFRATLVESELLNKTKKYYASLYELDDKDKDVGQLKLERFNVLTSKELKAKLNWWNPKLDLHLASGINSKAEFEWLGEIGMSILSYGLTDDDISWRFLRFGCGVTKYGFAFTFSPVQYNIAKKLWLVSNLWLTPYAGWNFVDRVALYGLGISVVF